MPFRKLRVVQEPTDRPPLTPQQVRRLVARASSDPNKYPNTRRALALAAYHFQRAERLEKQNKSLRDRLRAMVDRAREYRIMLGLGPERDREGP